MSSHMREEAALLSPRIQLISGILYLLYPIGHSSCLSTHFQIHIIFPGQTSKQNKLFIKITLGDFVYVNFRKERGTMHVPAAWMNMKMGPTQHPFQFPHLSVQTCTCRLLIKYISKLPVPSVNKKELELKYNKHQCSQHIAKEVKHYQFT